MKTFLLILVAVLLVPCVAWAQMPEPAPPAFPPGPPLPPGPPHGMHHPPGLGKWWKNSEVARELQLTDAQVNQIEQTFLENRLKLIDLRAELERQEARLEPLIEADQPDEAKVSAQIDGVLAARGKLEKQNAMMMLAIRRVLTVDQWKKLQAMRQQREGNRIWFSPGMHPPGVHPGGPSGPRAPGPPESDEL